MNSPLPWFQVTPGVVTFPPLEEMELFVDVTKLIIDVDVIGEGYAMCDLFLRACSGMLILDTTIHTVEVYGDKSMGMKQ